MIELRPYRPDDFDRVVELFAAVDIAAFGFPATTREELQQWFTSSRVDLERDTRLAFDNGRFVGYADVDTEDDGKTWWNSAQVDPTVDVAVVLNPLIEWAERRAGSGIARMWTASTLTEYRDALEAHGYARIRGSYRMRADIDASTSASTVDGIDIRPMNAGEERDVYEVHQETFADSWEHTREPYDEWTHYMVRTDGFDPTVWFVARDGNEIAGVCLCQERHGGGFVRVLGVRGAWRRRGIGIALLTHAFAEFARRGYDTVDLGVDAESLTGANRLYEAAGMRVVRQLDIFEKKLA